MSKFSTIKHVTTNQPSQHAQERAVYVVYSKGEIIQTYKQLSSKVAEKLDCIINKFHKDAYCGTVINVNPTEYERLCKMHKHT